MKKITLLLVILLASFSIQAQTDTYTVLANNGGTSQNGRAPQGGRPAGRSVWLITPTEMAASGLPNGHVVSLGFLYSVAHTAAITGNIVIYLQNTTDITNTKSSTWATAVTGMTTVSNAAVTLPATAGSFEIPFTNGTWFDYTGGGVYVAFDYQNFANPLSTTLSTALCNTSLTGGLLGALSTAAATTPPTALTASAFRPETHLGTQVSCARPTNLAAANTTLSSADLSFASTGGTIDIEYGPYGYTQGTGTTVANVTSPYTLNGLASSSVYDFYVRKNCGVGDSSVWAGPVAFNTVFTSVDPTYTESFENDILPFVGWLAVPNNTGDAWFINNGLAQDGLNTTASIAPTAVAADARMFSRGVNLVAGSTVNVSYYVENFVSGATTTASYELTVGSDQTAASQTLVVASETGLNNTAYVQKSFDFTAPSTGTFYFAVHNISPANPTGATTVQALLLDNFVVTQTLKNNEYLASKLNVFPNPAKDFVNFSNDINAVVSRIDMTDLNGRIVKTQSVNATSGQVSIGDLATGVYMMKIVTDQGLAVKKVVKE